MLIKPELTPATDSGSELTWNPRGELLPRDLAQGIDALARQSHQPVLDLLHRIGSLPESEVTKLLYRIIWEISDRRSFPRSKVSYDRLVQDADIKFTVAEREVVVSVYEHQWAFIWRYEKSAPTRSFLGKASDPADFKAAAIYLWRSLDWLEYPGIP